MIFRIEVVSGIPGSELLEIYFTEAKDMLRAADRAMIQARQDFPDKKPQIKKLEEVVPGEWLP